jgi:glycosyltransferase involved in cell wall biosynthesis
MATISEYNRDYLKELQCDTKKINIVRCGVEDFNTPTTKKETKKHKIGFIGRLVEKKGLEYLIKACPILIESGLDFQIEIIGDGPLMQPLQKLANDLNVSDWINFHGSVDNQKTISWLSSLDAFVLPCVKDSDNDMDGIPVALMEAMIARVPVVSTKVSGIPELIIHNKTGLLAKPRDAQDLAAQIIYLFNNKETNDEILNTAHQHVINEFNIDKNALRLYQHINA